MTNTNNKPHKKTLTAKQEALCQNIALHKMTQREAFMNAYPNSRNWKIDAVDQAANQELKKEHMVKRVQELSMRIEDKLVKKAVWTQEKAILKLESLAQQAEKEIEAKGTLNMTRVTAILGACKELNSMHGYNEKNVNTTSKVAIVGNEDELED